MSDSRINIRDLLDDAGVSHDRLEEWGRLLQSQGYYREHPESDVWIKHDKLTGDELRQSLCAAYGGGQIKQAQIAGEYPPPDVDVPRTVTGRFSSSKPNIREQLPSRKYRPAMDPRTEHVAKMPPLEFKDEPPRDLGRFNCRGDYVWPGAYATGPQKLSEAHVTKMDLSSVDYAEIEKRVAAWWQETHDRLIAEGFKPVPGFPDTYVKETPDDA